jgi:SAM-dependent methyltransferase
LPGAETQDRSRGARAYLSGAVRSDFDRWLDESVGRFVPPLSFREVRKGVQALSSLYVERRAGQDLSARAVEGNAKRAALATYYGPLHFLAAWHLFDEWVPEGYVAPATLWDLGCGTGAAGAAIARRLSPIPDLVGIDRSGFALREARSTYASFGVPAKTRRGRVPAALPRPREGDFWLFGYAINEFSESDRDALLEALELAIAAGVRVLILEPLASAATRWWPAWRGPLKAMGLRCDTWKRSLARPEWISRLDRAAGLDHRVLGARAALGP